MVNMIWMDKETGAYVVTHELFSRPAVLIGIVMPLVSAKHVWTSEELEAVVARYEVKLGYKLQKDRETPKILRLSEVERLCPINHLLEEAPGKVSSLKKIAIIIAQLVPDPEAYEGKSNADIEQEILAEMPPIPYVARIDKVTVLDSGGQEEA